MYDLVHDPSHPSYLVHVFVDTGASLSFQIIASGLISESRKRPETGVRINLVGGQNFMNSGDKVKMEVYVATKMGIKASIQDFLVLGNDVESLVWEYSGILHW